MLPVSFSNCTTAYTIEPFNTQEETTIQVGNSEEALKDIDYTINLHLPMNKKNAFMLIQRAFIYNQLDNYKGVAKDLNQAIRLDPTAYSSDALIFKILGRAYYAFGNYHKALSALNKSWDINKEDMEVLQDRYNVYCKLNYHKAAERVLNLIKNLIL